MRRARTRRLTAGLAIAATLLHAVVVSLHVAMIASLALAGDAVAGGQSAAFVICKPARSTENASIASPRVDSDGSAGSGSTGTILCPLCTGATVPALVLPDAAPSPVLLAQDERTAVTVTPAVTVRRYEVLRKLSRGPPQLI